MPYELGTFDVRGEPVGWGIHPNMNAVNGEKFWPPLPILWQDESGLLYCGWYAEELKIYYWEWKKN